VFPPSEDLCHEYVNALGAPGQVPESVVNVDPEATVPEMTGNTVAIGAKKAWTTCDVAVAVSIELVPVTTTLSFKFATEYVGV
jgi:hypothetical protein